VSLAIVFDLDGTLIDSAPDIHAAVNRALIAEGLAPLSFAQIKGFVGNGAPVLLSRCLVALGHPGDGPRHESLFRQFLNFYTDAHDLTRLYPNVVPALESLLVKGHRLGICTNKPILPTRAVLKHFGLDRLFSAVTGGDSFAVRKPDPLPLLETIRALGSHPAVFVGDSEVDAETAKAAALPFFLFTEGYRKSPVEALGPAAVFADHAALPALIATF
jgi:phosphoglycolate phosphatase